MKCYFILLFVVLANCQIDNIADQIINSYCPYRDQYGVNYLCDSAKYKYQDFTVLPVQIGVGWDPVQGTIKLPFLQMTYDKNKTYTFGSSVYYVPDQINLVPLDVTKPNYVDYTFNTPFDYANEMDPTRNVVRSGILSQNMENNNFLFEYFSGGSQYGILMTEYRNLYQLENVTDIFEIPIIPLVQKAIDCLPSQFDATIYSEFIQYWGTHVVYNADAGGFAQQMTTIKGCYEPGINIMDQAQLTMLKTLYAIQYQHIDYYATYQQYSKASLMNLYGGDPTIISPGDWAGRINTFGNYPVLTNVQVIPITNFIQDPTIRQNLQTAITNYFNNANQQISSPLTNWNTAWMAPQTITAMPTFVGLPGSGYPNSNMPGANIGTIGIIDTEIQIAGSQTFDVRHFPCTGTYPQSCALSYLAACMAYPNSMCSRNTDGEVISQIDTSQFGYRTVLDISSTVSNIQTGNPVRYGCSVASMSVKISGPNINSAWPSIIFHMYCCIGIEPVISGMPYIVHDTSSSWTTNPLEGTFSYNCPAF